MVIALYETEVNVVAHASKGEIEAVIEADRVILTVKDSGPGIPDIEKAMEEGLHYRIKEGSGDGLWSRYGTAQYQEKQ